VKVEIKETSNHNSKKEKREAKPKAKKGKNRFSVGDFVLYPMHGVGQIYDQKNQTVLSKRQEYYLIELKSSKMTVMVPVAKATDVGLRLVIDKKDVRRVLNLLKKDVEDTEEDWKIRYQNNMNKIKSGSIYQVSEVCRNLYRRAKDKELSIMERKLYETAYNLVTTEIATSKGMEIEDAGNLISEVLST